MAVPSTPGPLSRLAIFLVVGGMALVFGMLGFLHHVQETRPLASRSTPGAGTPSGAKTGTAAATANPSALTTTKPAADPAVARLVQTISDALAVLRDPHNANKKGALDALRDALAHAEPKVALAAIRQFLAGGENADTGQSFRVGEGGVLAEAPTLRTFLMDQLGSISRDAGTADAAEEARATIAANASPDETALAMRNLAWTDPTGSKPALAAAERAMLANNAWRQSPSAGYMEAFDVIAYTGDVSTIDDLATLAKTPSALQQAALVALERLSAMDPADVSSYLNAHPDILSDRPLLRADYMGNVDLSDPAQRAQAEAYLARTDVTDAEKDKFIARLVTPAGFVSNNLLTPATIAVSIPDHRALVNQVAGQWLASGKYPAQAGVLQSAVTNTAATDP